MPCSEHSGAPGWMLQPHLPTPVCLRPWRSCRLGLTGGSPWNADLPWKTWKSEGASGSCPKTSAFGPGPTREGASGGWLHSCCPLCLGCWRRVIACPEPLAEQGSLSFSVAKLPLAAWRRSQSPHSGQGYAVHDHEGCAGLPSQGEFVPSGTVEWTEPAACAPAPTRPTWTSVDFYLCLKMRSGWVAATAAEPPGGPEVLHGGSVVVGAAADVALAVDCHNSHCKVGAVPLSRLFEPEALHCPQRQHLEQVTSSAHYALAARPKLMDQMPVA